MSTRFFSHTTLCACIALLLTACVQRKETIIVHLDGSVDITVEHRSESESDLMDGDAPPAIDRGWFVERTLEEDDDGKITYILTAEAKFLPDEPLPDNYASVIDPYADTNLQFPMTIEFEQRRDGVYCHVRRVYESRPWAYYDRPQTMLKQEIKDVVGRDVEDMSPAERASVLNTFARIELLKIEYFAKAAFDDIAPDLPQDRWLVMRRNIKHAIDIFDTTRLVELIAEDEGNVDEAALVIEQQKLEDAALDAVRHVLADTSWYGAGATNSFIDRYTRHRRYFEITEDLGDEAFEINIELPGEIIAHNADEVTGSRATWKFTGEFLRDRDHELLATSRLPQ